MWQMLYVPKISGHQRHFWQEKNFVGRGRESLRKNAHPLWQRIITNSKNQGGIELLPNGRTHQHTNCLSLGHQTIQGKGGKARHTMIPFSSTVDRDRQVSYDDTWRMRWSYHEYGSNNCFAAVDVNSMRCDILLPSGARRGTQMSTPPIPHSMAKAIRNAFPAWRTRSHC